MLFRSRFTGLGGQFAEPPLVSSNGSGIVAYDGVSSYSVWADCFGVSLRRMQPGSEGGSGKGSASFSIDKSGNVTFGSNSSSVPPLAGCSSFASTPDTLAVTLPHSHSIYLVAPMISEQP